MTGKQLPLPVDVRRSLCNSAHNPYPRWQTDPYLDWKAGFAYSLCDESPPDGASIAYLEGWETGKETIASLS